MLPSFAKALACNECSGIDPKAQSRINKKWEKQFCEEQKRDLDVEQLATATGQRKIWIMNNFADCLSRIFKGAEMPCIKISYFLTYSPCILDYRDT